MEYICLGYLDEDKWQALSEQEREALMDECFAYDDVLSEGKSRIARDDLKSARVMKVLMQMEKIDLAT